MSPFATRNRHRNQGGFTLVELTIVLVIAGLLFAGLWRLMAGGNSSLTASAVAAQQSQLIANVKGYLSGSDGQALLTAHGNDTGNNPFEILLPSSNTGLANCQSTLSPESSAPAAGANQGICNYLPVGFTNATSNPYNQTFRIFVLKDTNNHGVAANSYSFMVITQNGSVIPDAQGGNISSLIGGDGGFIYTNAICGSPAGAYACGAYGAWNALVSAYWTGYGGTDNGHVASRTFVSPSLDSNQPWLARQVIPGDTSYGYNTMSTPLYLESQTVWGTSSMYVMGGTITSGTLGDPVAGDTSNIFLKGTGNANSSYPNPQPQITTSSACTNGSNFGKATLADATCPFSLQVNGDASITNFLQVGQTLYSNSDIRLKTNIATINDPLSEIMRIRPVSFNFKDGGHKSLGVIAQELEKVYPELVSDGPGMKAVNYQGLIAPLIGSVQELKEQNDELRRQLKENAQREDWLEDELRSLKPAP